MDTKEIIKRLQKQVGAFDDGYWGDDSQSALINSGKHLKYKDGALKANFGTLIQSQVDGFDAILSACNQYGSDAINPCYVAYMLATAWHETGIIVRRGGRRIVLHTMQPVEEMGKGRGRKYGKRIDINGTRYSSSLPFYYGRGYVQLTWLTNYVLMKKLIGVDFVNKPELALVPKYAAQIMIKGMLKGSFTGLSLSKCINYGLYFEFKKARRIINGTDKDELIADYAVKFLDCLEII